MGALRIILFVALFSTSNLVTAKEEVNCFDNAATTIAMHKCHQIEIEKANAKLDGTYKNLMGLVRNHGDEWVEDLEKAQDKWKEFRDLNCTFFANYLKGGSGAGLVSAGCRTRMTVEREKELNAKCSEMVRRGYENVD